MSRIFALLGINSSTGKVEPLSLDTTGDKPSDAFRKLCDAEGFTGTGKEKKHFSVVQLTRDGILQNSRRFATPEGIAANAKAKAEAEARAKAEAKAAAAANAKGEKPEGDDSDDEGDE